MRMAVASCAADSSQAFFLISVAALNILFIIMATRINIVFLLVFTGAFLGFVLAASARWCLAEGSTELAGRLVVVRISCTSGVS